jgi:Arc/MetJ-type ribon-helix-helix transcriptional regulator
MTVELRPEHEEIIREQLAGGQFKSVDEVLTMALSSLPHNRRFNRNAVQRMIQFSKENTVKLPHGETVEQLIRESHRY